MKYLKTKDIEKLKQKISDRIIFEIDNQDYYVSQAAMPYDAAR
jgi:hypothetical protein